MTNSSGLIIEDVVVGTGAEAVSGKRVTVHYRGTLTNGTKFDASYDRNKPFEFNLGAGEVEDDALRLHQFKAVGVDEAAGGVE